MRRGVARVRRDGPYLARLLVPESFESRFQTGSQIMSRYTFSLSPAYVVGRAANASDNLAVSSNGMPAWTFLSAVMLASMIFALIWVA
jgi:hypothetical protein